MRGIGSVELFAKFVKRYKKEPVRFVREVLGAEPTKQQCQLLEGYLENQLCAVRSGHGTGKDACVSWIILHFLLMNPMAKGVATAPTYRQLFDILRSELALWRSKSRLVSELTEMHKDKLFVKGYKDTWWFGFVSISSKDDPQEQAETLSGYHGKHFLAVIDEASGVKDPVFKPIESFLTKPNNRVICISNPTRSSGYFFNIFNDPGEKKRWLRLWWNSEESENVDKAWVERYRQKYGVDSPVYKVRVRGEFPPGGEDTLIPYEWALQCVGLNFGDESEEPMIVCGLDVARFGEDATVLTIQSGRYVLEQKELYKQDTETVAEWTAEHLLTLGAGFEAIGIDVTGGLGAGIADKLRRWFPGKVFDVNSCWNAFNKEFYYRLRDELWWRMREKLERMELSLPNSQKLIDDLCCLSFTRERASGRIKVQSKEELKRKGMSSPDNGDSCVLCRYFDTMVVGRALARKTKPKRRKRRLSWKLL